MNLLERIGPQTEEVDVQPVILAVEIVEMVEEESGNRDLEIAEIVEVAKKAVAIERRDHLPVGRRRVERKLEKREKKEKKKRARKVKKKKECERK